MVCVAVRAAEIGVLLVCVRGFDVCVCVVKKTLEIHPSVQEGVLQRICMLGFVCVCALVSWRVEVLVCVCVS